MGSVLEKRTIYELVKVSQKTERKNAGHKLEIKQAAGDYTVIKLRFIAILFGPFLVYFFVATTSATGRGH